MIYLTLLTIILITSVKFQYDPPGNWKIMIFYLPLFKTNLSQKSIKFLGVKIWNDIPLNIRNL